MVIFNQKHHKNIHDCLGEESELEHSGIQQESELPLNAIFPYVSLIFSLRISCPMI